MRWLILLFLALGLYADYPWSPNVRVSVEAPWDTLNQGESCFAIWGDSIFSVCNTAERGRVATAPFAYSYDGGQSFTQYPFIDSSTGITWHTDPVIEVDDSGRVHMLIQFQINLLNHYLSTDGGQTWCDTVTITSDYGVDKPWMIINKNEIYITWEQVSGQIGLWFAKSTDYGKTFTKRRIWNRTGISALCMDEEENIHLALLKWYQALYYRKSTDKGASWLPEHFLSDNYYQTGYGDRFPLNSITATGNVVFVTFVDTRKGDWDVWGIRSSDGGNTWGEKFVINDSSGGQCKGWAVFDPYGGLHVGYYHTPDWPTSSTSLFSYRYQFSPDSGKTFYPSIRVSDTAVRSMNTFLGEYHVLRTDSEYVYVIWSDGRNGDYNDLYFAKAKISELSCPEPTTAKSNPASRFSIPTLWRGKIRLNLPGRITLFDCTGRKIRHLSPGRSVIDSRTIPSGIIFVRARGKVYKVVNLH
ncbi:hypothetical protein DRP53_00600 [candidate division WOR-3 bacterium]|uniref:Exo-alpha-sialidase n=1 Tax=candidate division WOR-3 bacterium TaxID=2052148 RepID=A0A660SLN8_UNCW3|nr:MAG: hypothetical protein DRP53_00600 [candidate division WOR-3 bacterium]